MQTKTNPTLKDLDFTETGERIMVGDETKEKVMKMLEVDVQVSELVMPTVSPNQTHCTASYS